MSRRDSPRGPEKSCCVPQWNEFRNLENSLLSQYDWHSGAKFVGHRGERLAMSGPSGERPVGFPWEVQSIQLNVFPMEPLAAFGHDWLKEMFGDAAESAETTRKKNHREDKLTLGENRQLMVTIQPGKITWLEIAPIQLEVEDPPERYPALGPFAEARARFTQSMINWLPHCPPIWRVGLGAKLIQQTANQLEAYKIIGEYLKDTVKIDPEGSCDFQYRVNRPCQSVVVPGVKLNRLTTWNSLKLDFEVGVIVGVGTEKPTHIRSLSVCAVDLDINTAPEHTTTLASDVLPQLISEMGSHAERIADNGDMP